MTEDLLSKKNNDNKRRKYFVTLSLALLQLLTLFFLATTRNLNVPINRQKSTKFLPHKSILDYTALETKWCVRITRDFHPLSSHSSYTTPFVTQSLDMVLNAFTCYVPVGVKPTLSSAVRQTIGSGVRQFCSFAANSFYCLRLPIQSNPRGGDLNALLGL